MQQKRMCQHIPSPVTRSPVKPAPLPFSSPASKTKSRYAAAEPGEVIVKRSHKGDTDAALLASSILDDDMMQMLGANASAKAASKTARTPGAIRQATEEVCFGFLSHLHVARNACLRMYVMLAADYASLAQLSSDFLASSPVLS